MIKVYRARAREAGLKAQRNRDKALKASQDAKSYTEIATEWDYLAKAAEREISELEGSQGGAK